MPATGSLEVITGPMFSGKTDELIRRLRRARIARQKTQVFFPAIDSRHAGYEYAKVTSHAGTEFDATPVRSGGEILGAVEDDTRVVAIDEAQFFDDDILSVVKRLVDSGARVIVSGLDTDFRGEPFGPIPFLMAQAERIDKLQAICTVCGEPASRTQRLRSGKPATVHDPVVLVGDSEMYEARCRMHHTVLKE
jgi:thymidine kinase